MRNQKQQNHENDSIMFSYSIHFSFQIFQTFFWSYNKFKVQGVSKKRYFSNFCVISVPLAGLYFFTGGLKSEFGYSEWI